VVQAFPYGAVEIQELNSRRTFKVNGHRLKHFQEGRKEIEAEEIQLLC